MKENTQNDNQRVKGKNDHPSAGQEKGSLDFEKLKGGEKIEQDNDEKTQQIGADIPQIKFNEMDFAKRRIQSGFQARYPFCRGAALIAKVGFLQNIGLEIKITARVKRIKRK